MAKTAEGFLKSLLAEGDLPAEIVDVDAISDRSYVVWLSIPGESGKSIRLARALVREAMTGREARQHVLIRLRSAVAKLYSQRTVSSARELRSLDRHGRLCVHCGQPIAPGAAVAFLHGELFHLECFHRHPIPSA